MIIRAAQFQILRLRSKACKCKDHRRGQMVSMKLNQLSLPTTLKSSNLKTTSIKFLPALPERWKCQIQETSQKPIKKIVVHVVKEGETLTSISRLYGVPINDITASNKDIVDVDLVFEGQLLNVPSSCVNGKMPMCQLEKCRSSKCDFLGRYKKLNLYVRSFKLKFSSVLPVHHIVHTEGGMRKKFEMEFDRLLYYTRSSQDKIKEWGGKFNSLSSWNFEYYATLGPVRIRDLSAQAKSTGSFLALVPLIAFCIRCIVDALCNRVAREFKRQAVDQSGMHNHRSESKRWKSALSDLIDPDTLHNGVLDDSKPLPDDSDQSHSEDFARAYTELEQDYQKFLSECGMSNWGHWRGGSPD